MLRAAAAVIKVKFHDVLAVQLHASLLRYVLTSSRYASRTRAPLRRAGSSAALPM